MTNMNPDKKDLGYILYPRQRPHAPGYARLDVILRTIPTEHHFDPLQVHLSVVTPDHDVIRLTVEHPWPRPKDYPVCAGPVELVDLKGKHLGAFTFGGAVHIQPEEERTTLVLTSPAPILLPAEGPLDRILVEEVEIIFAQRQAAQEATPDLYEKHLAEAPPLELYHAMLATILERYRHLPYSENELILKFKHTLRAEIEAVQDQLSELHRRSIEGLL